MSLSQWVGFVERYVLEEDIYLQILNQQEKKGTQANKFRVCTCRYEEVRGVGFRAHDLEMQILFLLENPADSDKGTKYKIKPSTK